MSWFQKIAGKKQCVLVHGWEGGPARNWFPWLSEKLTQRGYKVINLAMPNPNTPKRSLWVKHIQDHVDPNSDTIFIAHSTGCMAVLRYLEKVSTKVKATILVAPFVKNEKHYKTLRSFFTGELRWSTIRRRMGKLFAILSDNDPYVSLWQGGILENKGATLFVEKNKDHFDGDTLPRVLKIIGDLD